MDITTANVAEIINRPINYIYFIDYDGKARKTFAYVPVEKNTDGKYDMYFIAHVKYNGIDAVSKDKARDYATEKLIRHLSIYAKANIDAKAKILENFKKKGIMFISFKELSKIKERANKNKAAMHEIKRVMGDVIYPEY